MVMNLLAQATHSQSSIDPTLLYILVAGALATVGTLVGLMLKHMNNDNMHVRSNGYVSKEYLNLKIDTIEKVMAERTKGIEHELRQIREIIKAASDSVMGVVFDETQGKRKP